MTAKQLLVLTRPEVELLTFCRVLWLNPVEVGGNGVVRRDPLFEERRLWLLAGVEVC